MSQDLQALSRVQRTVERFVRGRPEVPGPDDHEDVVQETMARLLEHRSRLEPDAWEAYAVVSARNLLLDRERAGHVRRRHEHRLHAPDVSAGLEEHVLTQEEHAALRRAMTTLPADDRVLLTERYAGDEHDGRSIAPATATRLARARGRLRVAYLLEHAQVALPTERCRPVLEALSSADRRRQERLGAGRHLRSCRVCATYAPALARRERALAALHPLGWLGLGTGAVWAAVRRHPGRTATASVATAAAVLAGAAVVVPPGREPAAVPTTAPSATAGPAVSAAPASVGSLRLLPDGRELLPLRGSPLPLGPVRARGVVVQAVPADEGFWVGSGPGQRVWVQLVGAGESPSDVRAGDTVSFDGRVVPLSPGAPAVVGLTAAEGADELRATGSHVEVPHSSLVVQR